MNNPPDGGPAFAGAVTIIEQFLPNGGIASHPVNAPGMSLRDWFAGQALIGMFSNPSITNEDSVDDCAEGIARIAYKQADAMLAARKGGQP